MAGNGPNTLVTVITVTYNSSLYVRAAIESVLGQDYGNIEYIIGDDCSTDDTWDIIQGYSDPRIRAYRNSRNMGEYPNRNKAISMATGKYILFIDGDDLIYEHGVGIYLKYALQYPGAGMVVQKAEINRAVYPLLLDPADAVLNYFKGYNLLTSSFGSNFFRADVLQSYRLPLAYAQGDEYIRLKIASHMPTLIIPGSLTWIRETPGQASAQLNNVKGLSDHYRLKRDLAEDFKGLGTAAFSQIARATVRQLSAHLVSYAKRLQWRYAMRTSREIRFYKQYIQREDRVTYRDLSQHSPMNPLTERSTKTSGETKSNFNSIWDPARVH